MTIATHLTEDEQATESHWLTKGDQGLLFLIIENKDYETPLIMMAAYTKYEDGYSYNGPTQVRLLGNRMVTTGLSTRWNLEQARVMWRLFLSDGWKYEEEWAKIPR